MKSNFNPFQNVLPADIAVFHQSQEGNNVAAAHPLAILLVMTSSYDTKNKRLPRSWLFKKFLYKNRFPATQVYTVDLPVSASRDGTTKRIADSFVGRIIKTIKK